MREWNKDTIEKNFVDEDGWLTYAISEGGKKRLTFTVACHSFRVPPTTGNTPTSNEVYAELVKHPENLAIVIADTPTLLPSSSANNEPYSCVLATVCDAAGLIEVGKTIVCLDLSGYKFPIATDGSGTRYGWSNYNYYRSRTPKFDLYGSTAKKHDEIARELISLGAELVCAPKNWGGGTPKCRIVGWRGAERWSMRDFAWASYDGERPHFIRSNAVPIIDADTPTLRKIAGSFAGDEAEKLRKTALTRAKDIFAGLELTPQEVVDLLSYGMLEWKDAKSKSYKVPVWKQKIIKATAERFSEFNGGQGSDASAEKINACRLIWSDALNAYGISFKRGRESHDEIIRVWKELGATMGVDSSVEAVLKYGVPVEDVTATCTHADRRRR